MKGSGRAMGEILEGRRSRPERLIEALYDVQETFGYIPGDAMRTLSSELGVPLTDVYGAAGYYKVFSLEPVKKGGGKKAARGEAFDWLMDSDPGLKRKIIPGKETPADKKRGQLLLSRMGPSNQGSIEEYIAAGGYAVVTGTLKKMTPEGIIRVVRKSDLGKWGGAGEKVAAEWEECAAAGADEKYVVCATGEGYSGASVDRVLLEGNPHLVLEGMITGAAAVGASRGIVYIGGGMRDAAELMTEAVRQVRKRGICGENIRGKDFAFDIEVVRGGGGLMSGEPTALIHDLEGKAGEPAADGKRYVSDGVRHKPTVIDSVETWARVPGIVESGGVWGGGTKIFALSGRVRNAGLVEVPIGTPLEEIVFGAGGGGVAGRVVKAVLAGGPAGALLPPGEFDRPVDSRILCRPGGNGIVVLDEGTCVVNFVKGLLSYLRDETCGKCASCRLGMDRMLEILTDVTGGRGCPAQLSLLRDLAWTVSESSLCAIGKAAADPVLSSFEHFASEYEAHVNGKCCPTGVCRS